MRNSNKIGFKRVICFILAFQLFNFNQHFTSYASSQSSNNVKKSKVHIYDAVDAEEAFYKGDFEDTTFVFEALAQKKDRNYALFNNQLGSIYLSEGDYEKALEAFLEAYYLMNDAEVFSNLEANAMSLLGTEERKAYKGDPYEKVFNSLYVSLLFNHKGDIDNALAALKNGILCDSDVKGDLYQSDVFILYLLAARLSLMQGNNSLSEDYFRKAKEAYYLTVPCNIALVAQEQSQKFLLIEKQEDLDKLRNPKKYGIKPKGTVIYRNKELPTKIERLELDIDKITKNIKKLSDERKNNSAKIDASLLNKFTNLDNNVLLCIELGKGPLKYPIGQYGQMAVFTVKPHGAETINVIIDNQPLIRNLFLLNNDAFFQAITRGGRQMDGVLKGQAQFKQATANMSTTLCQMSQNIINNANQMRSVNPYYDASGANMQGAIVALIGLGFAIASNMSNPAADVRHWSLLPGNIMIVPLSLTPGKHSVKIEIGNAKDKDSNNLEFDIEVKKAKDTIVFKRIL